MKKYDDKLSKDAELLNQYLDQYRYCIRLKKSLEYRRKEIIKEFEYPLSSVNYDGMPKGNSVGVGCAALAYRLDEIDTKIKEQMNNAAKALSDIMNVIEFLPESTLERSIIEHRYIDRYTWDRICRVEHISRTPANKHWKKGLYQLLEFKRVQQILSEYDRKCNSND